MVLKIQPQKFQHICGLCTCSLLNFLSHRQQNKLETEMESQKRKMRIILSWRKFFDATSLKLTTRVNVSSSKISYTQSDAVISFHSESNPSIHRREEKKRWERESSCMSVVLDFPFCNPYDSASSFLLSIQYSVVYIVSLSQLIQCVFICFSQVKN